MEYTLTMTFLTETGEKSNISISDVKAGITNEEVQVLMDSLIANNIFENKKVVIRFVFTFLITALSLYTFT